MIDLNENCGGDEYNIYLLSPSYLLYKILDEFDVNVGEYKQLKLECISNSFLNSLVELGYLESKKSEG